MATVKQNLLDIPKKRDKKLKDPCPVCDYELYLDSRRSKRIGLIDSKDRIVGWICSKCSTEFSLDNKVVVLFSETDIRGEA